MLHDFGRCKAHDYDNCETNANDPVDNEQIENVVAHGNDEHDTNC